MPRAIGLRSDLTAARLRGLARRAKDAAQARCLLALAVIHDAGSRAKAPRLGQRVLQCAQHRRVLVINWLAQTSAMLAEGRPG